MFVAPVVWQKKLGQDDNGRVPLALSVCFLFSTAAGSGFITVFIAVLDVGHGAANVQLPAGGNILVDAGGFANRGTVMWSSKVIAPFLWHQRIWHLDTVVISHPDGDHYNVSFLVEHFSPKLVVVNTDPGKEDGYKEFCTKSPKRVFLLSVFKVIKRCYKEKTCGFPAWD